MISTYPQTWERNLLSLAYEARRSTSIPSIRSIADTSLLARAYAQCDSIAATYSRSFYLATSLLPADKRRANRALYAFCRVTDNIVDCPDGDPKRSLAAWRRKALGSEPAGVRLVATALGGTRPPH